MSFVIIRLFIYTILPLLIACSLIVVGKNIFTRERKLETFLVYLFSLGVAGSGIGGFFGHFFISDLVAESIGWPVGSPFQPEVGFANLALGALGLVATAGCNGFREATVIAVRVFAIGARKFVAECKQSAQTGTLDQLSRCESASRTDL
ncbi:MAG: hypothetical protein HOH43_17410 [Candidatus Latescibacteria bacterium]|nr:hypothetical protein [Candidatus Latescibacterota bacterium]